MCEAGTVHQFFHSANLCHELLLFLLVSVLLCGGWHLHVILLVYNERAEHMTPCNKLEAQKVLLYYRPGVIVIERGTESRGIFTNSVHR